MKEVRLHGRGGQGLLRAAHIIVKAAVASDKYATFIPYFGVERRGSPVYGFLRLDDKPIRLKTQVYRPDCVIVLDDTLLDEVDVYEGMKENAFLVINTRRTVEQLGVPKQVSTIGLVNATDIALKHINRSIPNTVILGAFCRTTNWLSLEAITDKVEKEFDSKNSAACDEGYRAATIIKSR